MVPTTWKIHIIMNMILLLAQGSLEKLKHKSVQYFSFKWGHDVHSPV